MTKEKIETWNKILVPALLAIIALFMVGNNVRIGNAIDAFNSYVITHQQSEQTQNISIAKHELRLDNIDIRNNKLNSKK